METDLKFTLSITNGGEVHDLELGARHIEVLVSIYSGDSAEYAGMFAAAARHPSVAVRRAVASLQNLPADAALALAKDPCASVRRFVIQSRMYLQMADDESVLALIGSDPEVAENVACSVSQFENADIDVLCEALSQHPDTEVRRALANNGATPMKWLRKLRGDGSKDVADTATETITQRSL